MECCIVRCCPRDCDRTDVASAIGSFALARPDTLFAASSCRQTSLPRLCLRLPVDASLSLSLGADDAFRSLAGQRRSHDAGPALRLRPVQWVRTVVSCASLTCSGWHVNLASRSLAGHLTGSGIHRPCVDRDTTSADRQVVYGREIWFGNGISTAAPGHTPHGQPMQRLSMGETGVDEATLLQWLRDRSSRWTASLYHLLEHNWCAQRRLATADCAATRSARSSSSALEPFGVADDPASSAAARSRSTSSTYRATSSPRRASRAASRRADGAASARRCGR